MSHLRQHNLLVVLILNAGLAGLAGCSDDSASEDAGPVDTGTKPDISLSDIAAIDAPRPDAPGPDQFVLPAPICKFVTDGIGPAGKTKIKAEVVVSGLVMPWGLAFLSADKILATEMPGQVRLISKGKLAAKVVVQTSNLKGTPGQGMQGIVLHPKFAQNRFFYLHYFVKTATEEFNRVARYKLATDDTSATLDKIILDKIPTGAWHNGGRMRFGKDNMLYISTGDAHSRDDAQDKTSLAGKILRVTDEGKIPADNPWSNNPAIVIGIRNSQGFDFFNNKALYVVDHGPSGEMGRSGQDEVNLAGFGDNLGWPTISGCSTAPGKLPPSLSWKTAVPPGSAVYYQSDKIPGWKGSLVVATLGSMALLRVVFDAKNPRKVISHESYFEGKPPKGFGRLRTVEMGPDGHLYVFTSNCDDHGTCSGPKDQLLRIKL